MQMQALMPARDVEIRSPRSRPGPPAARSPPSKLHENRGTWGRDPPRPPAQSARLPGGALPERRRRRDGVPDAVGENTNPLKIFVTRVKSILQYVADPARRRPWDCNGPCRPALLPTPVLPLRRHSGARANSAFTRVLRRAMPRARPSSPFGFDGRYPARRSFSEGGESITTDLIRLAHPKRPASGGLRAGAACFPLWRESRRPRQSRGQARTQLIESCAHV